jgi:cytochrome bd-type quinol oxidase subunit 1
VTGTIVTGAFLVSGIGAFYLLRRQHEDQGRLFVRLGVPLGLAASVAMAFPTGDQQGKKLARYQPATLAAMEGLFATTRGAPRVRIGPPDMERRALDNAVEVPRALSFLTYNRWSTEVQGLDARGAGGDDHRVRGPRRLRPRRRHRAPRHRPRLGRALEDARRDRPLLGRQRGLAHRRGRRARVRVPGAVRDQLQRLLPAAD